MIKLFQAVGSAFAEGTFVGSETPTGGALTPQAAKNKIAGMFADQEFMGRYMNRDEKIRQGAIEEMMRLQRMANPELFTE